MLVKRSYGDKIFDIINVGLMLFVVVITVYPMLYVLFASISEPMQLMSHTGLILKPLGFSLKGYKLVLANPNIVIGYRNTLFYVIVGTSINLFLTILGAFILSRKKYLLKKFFMIMVIITMYFSGGIVPRYLLISNIGMLNTIWALLLPNAISTWNLIIMRTSFLTIPAEIEESTKIDGANDIVLLFRIIVPLSIPVIAVIALFYSVNHWNAWFDAMIYIRNRKIYPLQLFLREILIQDNTVDMTSVAMMDDFYVRELVKYCTIIVATVPILCVYPFLQRYFIKGIMVGALKG